MQSVHDCSQAKSILYHPFYMADAINHDKCMIVNFQKNI